MFQGNIVCAFSDIACDASNIVKIINEGSMRIQLSFFTSVRFIHDTRALNYKAHKNLVKSVLSLDHGHYLGFFSHGILLLYSSL